MKFKLTKGYENSFRFMLNKSQDANFNVFKEDKYLKDCSQLFFRELVLNLNTLSEENCSK